MSSMKEMDAFNNVSDNNLDEDNSSHNLQEPHDFEGSRYLLLRQGYYAEGAENKLHQTESKPYIKLESGTGAKFFGAMRKAFDTKKRVQTTIKVKSNSSRWIIGCWVVICNAFVKEAFGIEPTVFVRDHGERTTIGLNMLYKLVIDEDGVECRKVGEDISFRIIFPENEYNHWCAYKHFLYLIENVKNLQQSTSGLQGKELAIGIANWLRERTIYSPLHASGPDNNDRCILLYSDDLRDKKAKGNKITLTVAYCEYSCIAGLDCVIPVDKLPIEIPALSNMTNCLVIDQVVYFLDITCEKNNGLKLQMAEELGIE